MFEGMKFKEEKRTEINIPYAYFEKWTSKVKNDYKT